MCSHILTERFESFLPKRGSELSIPPPALEVPCLQWDTRPLSGDSAPPAALPGYLLLATAKHCRTDVALPGSHGQFREEELDGPFCVTGTGPLETTKTMSKHRMQLENSMKLINISSTGQIWAPAVACRSRIRSNLKSFPEFREFLYLVWPVRVPPL